MTSTVPRTRRPELSPVAKMRCGPATASGTMRAVVQAPLSLAVTSVIGIACREPQ